jgi:DNA polymerase-3 subunit epsilon
MILFFDTETTGKADFRSGPEAPHQPRLVQFAGVLCDDECNEISSANIIIRPDGFTIPQEASDIHGITTEIALERGVDCSAARTIYRRWWHASSLVTAHNVSFDLLMMDIEMCRKFGDQKWGEPRDTFCTMQSMTPICKLPGNYGDFKWPKLQEAHKYCFGDEFDDAHDAMADVRACIRVYRWLKHRERVEA